MTVATGTETTIVADIGDDRRFGASRHGHGDLLNSRWPARTTVEHQA